jgi:hypothetical protein
VTQKLAIAGSAAPAEPMMAGQRARFERDGYLIIRDALRPDEIATARDALDRVYAAAARAGSLGPDGSLHLLSAVANCPEVVGLIDHPATFRYPTGLSSPEDAAGRRGSIGGYDRGAYRPGDEVEREDHPVLGGPGREVSGW